MQMLAAPLPFAANPALRASQPGTTEAIAVDFSTLLNGLQQEEIPEPAEQSEQAPEAADAWLAAALTGWPREPQTGGMASTVATTPTTSQELPESTRSINHCKPVKPPVAPTSGLTPLAAPATALPDGPPATASRDREFQNTAQPGQQGLVTPLEDNFNPEPGFASATNPERLSGAGSVMPSAAVGIDVPAASGPAEAETMILASRPQATSFEADEQIPAQLSRSGLRPTELAEARFENLLPASRTTTIRGPTCSTRPDTTAHALFPASSSEPDLLAETASTEPQVAMAQESRVIPSANSVPASTREDLAGPLPANPGPASGLAPADEPTPCPANSSPFVTEQQVLDQVVQRISLDSVAGGRRLTMDLQPAELGQVHLEVIQDQDHIQVRLLAQSSEVQGILERSLPQLQEALQQQGLRLDSIQVDIDQRHVSPHSQQQFQQQASSQGQRNGTRQQGERPIPAFEPVAVAASTSSLTSGLSLRI